MCACVVGEEHTTRAAFRQGLQIRASIVGALLTQQNEIAGLGPQ